MPSSVTASQLDTAKSVSDAAAAKANAADQAVAITVAGPRAEDSPALRVRKPASEQAAADDK